MAEFGNWTPIIFSNAGPPAIDEDALNDIEDWIEITDNEGRKSQTVNFKDLITYFWERNVKEIDNLTDASEWVADASTTVSNDTTHNVIGVNAVKFAESNDVASWVGMERAITSIDLTKFHDGRASSTNDIIMILFYVDEITKFTNFQLKLGNSNAKNYGNAWNPAGFSNGWNVRFLKKSAFGTTGAPDWSDIDYIRTDAYTTANASGHYFTIQYIQMIRNDPTYDGYPNPFQEYFGTVTEWVNKFWTLYDVNALVYDEKFDRMGFMKVIAEDIEADLEVYPSCYAFQGRFEIYCKYAGYTPSIVWIYDADNYICCYVSANTFYIYAMEGGVPTSDNIALSNNLLLNERVLISFEKDYDTGRAILIKDGEPIKILEYETTITDSGAVYLSTKHSNAWGIFTDFAVSNNIGSLDIYHDYSKGPKMYHLEEEQTYVNNTLTVIDDFLIRLAPNKVFKIEAYFDISCTSDTPDAKVDWNYSNVSAIHARAMWGGIAVTASTEPSVDNKIRTSHAGLSSDIRYAASSYSSPIKETFFIKTLQTGGYIQARMAQYTTDAINPLKLGTNSSVIVTEVYE